MSAVCLVTSADYRRYFDGTALCASTCGTLVCDREAGHDGLHRGYYEVVDEVLFWQSPQTWSGSDRRVGLADRRQAAHDRRWDAARGRRQRVSDRRRDD